MTNIKSLRMKYRKKGLDLELIENIALDHKEPENVRVAMIRDLFSQDGKNISDEDASWAIRRFFDVGGGFFVYRGLFPTQQDIDKSVSVLVESISGFRDYVSSSRLEDVIQSRTWDMISYYCPSVVHMIRQRIRYEMGLDF